MTHKFFHLDHSGPHMKTFGEPCISDAQLFMYFINNLTSNLLTTNQHTQTGQFVINEGFWRIVHLYVENFDDKERGKSKLKVFIPNLNMECKPLMETFEKHQN